MGQPNPVHPEHTDEFFPDDCPICEYERAHLKAALESGEEHGFHWHYDDGGYPLIAHYDPEGWDERWAADVALSEAMHQNELENQSPLAAPSYEPPPTDPKEMDPQAFLEALRQPWVDPALYRAAEKLTEYCDVPVPDPVTGLRYRRVTRSEALSLLAGLDGQGVDINALLTQMDAWPYQNIALDWLSDPLQNVAMFCLVLEQDAASGDQDGQTRVRQHRDFVFALGRVVPPSARIWLRGWLEAVGIGAFAPTDLPF